MTVIRPPSGVLNTAALWSDSYKTDGGFTATCQLFSHHLHHHRHQQSSPWQLPWRHFCQTGGQATAAVNDYILLPLRLKVAHTSISWWHSPSHPIGFMRVCMSVWLRIVDKGLNRFRWLLMWGLLRRTASCELRDCKNYSVSRPDVVKGDRTWL